MAKMKRWENQRVPREELLDPVLGIRAIERRLARIEEPHIRFLTEWVVARKADPRLPEGAGRTIPWIDPESGGKHSRVLLLLQDPSETATTTRFISPDNNDPTARNTTEACSIAGLRRDIRLHWNVYPWWVNTRKNGRPRDATRPVETWDAASRLAAQLWGSFFDLLPELRVIALFGKQTQEGWLMAVEQGLSVPRGVRILPELALPLPGLSLSPQQYPKHKQAVVDVLSEAREIAERA